MLGQYLGLILGIFDTCIYRGQKGLKPVFPDL